MCLCVDACVCVNLQKATFLEGGEMQFVLRGLKSEGLNCCTCNSGSICIKWLKKTHCTLTLFLAPQPPGEGLKYCTRILFTISILFLQM